MGKYANLFSGIFVFSLGYFVESMYSSVVANIGQPETVVPIEKIVGYISYFFLGLGGLLMLLGIIGIAVSLIKKAISESKEEEMKDRREERRPSDKRRAEGPRNGRRRSKTSERYPERERSGERGSESWDERDNEYREEQY